MITIKGTEVEAVSPEGATAKMKLSDFINRIAPPVMDTGEHVLHDGVKSIQTIGPTTIVVHETPPRIYNLKWLTDDSPQPYGDGAKYKNVKISLPYVVVLATFNDGHLTHDNECYFRTSPLVKMDDELYFPALLNVSKIGNASERPTWICVQHLNYGKLAKGPAATRMRDALAALWQCIVGTGFNRSSEQHEGASWYGEYAKVDKRIGKISAWEENTEKDPCFVLDVPWLGSPRNLNQTIANMFKRFNSSKPVMNAEYLAKQLFNSKKK